MYAAPGRTLEIQCRGGYTHRYFDVPPSTYTDVLGAVSKGKFLHPTIRGRFAHERLPPTEEPQGQDPSHEARPTNLPH